MAGNGYKFSTTDMRFGLTIEQSLMDAILHLCREASGIETGGILVGYYNDAHDNAIVTDISAPPSDSRRQRTTFDRGVKGLQSWLNRLWTHQRRYYLGEWHFHPFANPAASATDLDQMRGHADAESLRCPEPVMLVIGGDPQNAWSVKAYVSPKRRSAQEMMMADANTEGL